MARAGRKSKPGKRHKCGKRIVEPRIIKGNDRAEARKAIFGTNGTSALGRAFVAGLLGEPQLASARHDAGKRFARLYSAFIEQGRYRCPLNGETRSGGLSGQNEGNPREQESQQWLFAMMDALDTSKLRPWLDVLILDLYHDNDPPFLGRLLHGGKDPADKAMLDNAIAALDIVSNLVKSES